MGWILGFLVLLFVAAQAWVRLAPADPGQWHALPEMAMDRDMEGGAVRVIPAYPDTLSRLDAIARATPRTTVLAGSPASGMTTYVTRSAFWGFPDYTTVGQRGDRVILYARLRFGRGDFGVNRGRLESWLAELG
ncbi:DUF1499 domain-containing protein [Pseudooceanicola sp. LIPI14-2-Ac024]|uniref:DUF1499 domain-containing protein n=1 Tax=Pseudooceanicola sp. LIPI14-2-Ac024 TaxID=3344875 RepID=UPI0035CEE4E5